ncbi:MAG: flagellar protein FliS, partial [Desulfobacterales bacterium]
LACSLDFEKGGAIAGNLNSLYNYMIRRILNADVNRDIEAIDEVIGMLEELRSAWQSIYMQKDIQTRSSAENFNQNKAAMTSGHISV